MKAFFGPFCYLIFLFVHRSEGRKTEKNSFIDGILRESLRPNRVQACDGERITLNCPRNTQILVQTGFYGRVVPESQLCPPVNGPISSSSNYYSTCDVIQAHTRISEVCDKRRKCSIVVDSHTFDDDPCPSTSKYLQMSYACLPVSFDDETFCSSDEMRLECREGRRLAVYSAVMEASPKCSLKNNTSHRECSHDVLPTLLESCHAKSACTISKKQLENKCKDSHLHIVYMCVNEEIFSEDAIKGEIPSLVNYIKESKSQKSMSSRIEEEEWEKLEVPAVPEPTSKPLDIINNDASYVTHDEYRMVEDPKLIKTIDANVVGIGHDVVQIVTFIRENKEKAITCMVLSLLLAAIIVLSTCIMNKLCQKEPKLPKASRMSMETSRLFSPHYGVGTPTSHHLCDIDDECFMRYTPSVGNKTTYTHYDF